ncbi:hypothetical protein CLOM_g21957 [Closterium sp. NIES-68]|nr:hypothetical protein CLOM_g21957 [Closterium sp. NIES-68]GJP75131.1 hypothetical protein CLOP_g5617 [Closterium sp. NIES-67]
MHGRQGNGLANGTFSSVSLNGDADTAEVEHLRRRVKELEASLAAALAESATAKADLASVSAKLAAVRREKEVAVQAADRRIETLRRELAVLVDEREEDAEIISQGKRSVARAEEYLRALDVAKVEVKRLRLERDLLHERIQALEHGGGAGGAMATVGWLVPPCLMHVSEHPRFTPDTPR